MKLRVVGSSSAVPRPGRACSSYLVLEGETKVVLDFGTGALGSLLRFADCRSLDAIFISHFHPDHFMDLIQLHYALTIPKPVSKPLDVYVPPGGVLRLNNLAQSIPSAEPFFAVGLALHDYDPAGEVRVERCSVRFEPATHYIEAYAMRVTSRSGTIVYSGDTAPSATVSAFARRADLFLCEAALGADGEDDEPRGHCTAREAAQMARDAEVGHLVLTHYAQRFKPSALAAAAAEIFQGMVTVADDGMEIPVG